MATSHSVMEPGPTTGSMVVGDNDDNNNDDILTRAEAIELEEIARSPEHNKESREIAATLLQNDAQSRLTNVIAAVTNGEASPSVADRMLNAAERRVNHVGTMLDEIVESRTTTPQSTTVVLPPYGPRGLLYGETPNWRLYLWVLIWGKRLDLFRTWCIYSGILTAHYKSPTGNKLKTVM